MAGRQQVFVAYPARDQALAAGIMDAVRKANALPLPIRYEPWAFNDVAGSPIISPVLGKIDEAPYVVADISYLNLNVVYEIGFTIGRRKRAFIVRNGSIKGDKAAVKAVGIFDTLESVRKHHAGLQSFRSMRRIEARRKKASAWRFRFSQSFASLRQRLSQAMVRSTIQRRGSTTNPVV